MFRNVVVMRGTFLQVWQIIILRCCNSKGGKPMDNRKRNVQLIIRVTEEERKFIEEKMKMMPTMNLSAYARKMLIDGYILFLDTPEIKAHSAQLQKIGGNINQIVKRMHQTGSLYKNDVEEVKQLLAEVWKTERQIGRAHV